MGEVFKQLLEIAKTYLGKFAFIVLLVLLGTAFAIFYLVSHPDAIEAVIAASICLPAALWYGWQALRKGSRPNLAISVFVLAILFSVAWASWLAIDLTSKRREIARSLKSGEEATRYKDYTSAKKHFEDARDLAKTSKSYKNEEAASLFLLGQTHMVSAPGSPEEVQKARENFESAFDLAGDNLNMKARVRVAQAEIAADNDQARQYLTEATEFAGKLKVHDSYLEATIFRGQGDVENAALNREQAILYYRKATESYAKGSAEAPLWRRIFTSWFHRGQSADDNRQGEADVLNGLGNLDFNAGHLTDARKEYTQSGQLYHDLRQPREEAYTLLGLGDLDRTVNHFEDARKNYAQAKGLFYNEPRGQATVFLSLGALEGTLGNMDTALWECKRALELFAADKGEQLNVLLVRAHFETDLGNYGEARNDLNAAAELSRDGDDPLGAAMVLEAKARLDTEIGKEKKDEARDYFTKARVTYVNNSDMLGEADVLLGVGRWESKYGDPNAATKDFDDAYKLYAAEEIPFGQADVLYQRAELERTAKKYDLAASDYQAARKIYEKESQDVSKIGVANVLLGLGDLAESQGSSDEARRDYDLARRMYEEQKNLIGQANVDYSEGMHLHGDPAEARDHLNKAKNLYSGMGKPEQVAEVQKQLSKYRGLAAAK